MNSMMGWMAAALLAVPCVAAAQDLVKTSGGMAKVLREDARMRVIELTVPPGKHTGMHTHGEGIVYFLTPSIATQIEPDGAAQTLRFQQGEVHPLGRGAHDTVNSGAAPTRTLIVELKPPR